MSLEKKVIEHLKCPICFESFRSPKVLPCQHTFCEDCLAKQISSDGTCSCTVCSNTVPLTSTESLPANLLACNLIDTVRSMKEEETRKCELCVQGEEQAAISRCLTCDCKLCDYHVNCHKRTRNTRDHKLEQIEVITNISKIQKGPHKMEDNLSASSRILTNCNRTRGRSMTLGKYSRCTRVITKNLVSL